jgi:glycosyltransferase involved in cell wall biosynthesis
MNPERVLCIDVGHLHNDTDHVNKATYRERYANYDTRFVEGWIPTAQQLYDFLNGLDVVYTAETAYNNDLYRIARQLGVKTVLAPNYEFLDTYAQPSVWAAPSLWHFDELPVPKTHLPVPIATDRFTSDAVELSGHHFLHIVGRPAVHDRNGTQLLLQALEFVESEVTVTIRCQRGGYVTSLAPDLKTPGNVTLIVDPGDKPNYWDNYTGDVLIMPRRYGGLCLPVNEALGAGMPVIMPDISPNNTWLPQDWLVAAGWETTFWAKRQVDVYGVNPKDLAAKIDQFCDPDFLLKAKDEASRLRTELSWETLKPRYLEVLNA